MYLLPVCTLLHTLPVNRITTPPENKTRLEKNFFRFGDQLVSIESHGHPDARNYVLLSLHSNESSSVNASLNFSKNTNTLFIRLVNNEKQLIEGDFLDQQISFDPNNIYTDWGRKEHLKDNKCWTKYLDMKVEQFAEFILNEIPYNKAIVSLHTHHAWTIRDYMEKRKLRKQVKEIYRNPAMPASEYYITTDDLLYSRIKNKELNVILMHPKKMENKGELAVYCAREKRPYVQIETREESTEAQEKMLMALDSILK